MGCDTPDTDTDTWPQALFTPEIKDIQIKGRAMPAWQCEPATPGWRG